MPLRHSFVVTTCIPTLHVMLPNYGVDGDDCYELVLHVEHSTAKQGAESPHVPIEV